MIGIPRLLLYLMGNTLTQYICISAVFILTTECASLTVTLVVTLRKVNIINRQYKHAKKIRRIISTLNHNSYIIHHFIFQFGSLLFSIWYFNNSFTPYHWIGTILVFSGTLVFSLKKDTISEKSTKTSQQTEKKELKLE